jgi:hypothetical protein
MIFSRRLSIGILHSDRSLFFMPIDIGPKSNTSRTKVQWLCRPHCAKIVPSSWGGSQVQTTARSTRV